MTSGKSGTYAKIKKKLNILIVFQIATGKSGTFEKFGGARKFKKNIRLEKNGTFKNFWDTRTFRKNKIFKRTGDPKKSWVLGNLEKS